MDNKKLPFRNILLLYKRSAYRIYFMNRNSSFVDNGSPIIKDEIKKFKDAHDEHYGTLKGVSKILFTHGIRFTECYRGRNIDYSPYDLIITVGGDGTFLEAARKVKNQVMLGVNSAPHHSVGRFCIANLNNFEKILKKIMNQQYSLQNFHRIRIKHSKEEKTVDALNDLLICHKNPAMLSRYYLKIGDTKEEQRSSGIWISSPVGSSGAIRSAGGKLLNQYDKKIQYLPRELYSGLNGRYKLTGRVLNPPGKIRVTSLMRRGMLYLDGAHQKFNFDYGISINISISPNPIRTINLEKK